jgi:hypothetical protein
MTWAATLRKLVTGPGEAGLLWIWDFDFSQHPVRPRTLTKLLSAENHGGLTLGSLEKGSIGCQRSDASEVAEAARHALGPMTGFDSATSETGLAASEISRPTKDRADSWGRGVTNLFHAKRSDTGRAPKEQRTCI